MEACLHMLSALFLLDVFNRVTDAFLFSPLGLTGLLLVPARTRRSAGPMCYPVCSFVFGGGILQPPPFWCGG